MKDKLNTIILQVNTIWENIEGNLLLINELLKDVDNTDLILLPEAFNTGFTPHARAFAESANGGRTLEWMLNTATKHNAAVGGTIFVNDNGVYYNRFYFVTHNGKVSHYDKQHLFSLSFESNILSPGKGMKLVEYEGWNICLQTCYDLRFSTQNTFTDGKYGYDLIINAANWPSSRTMQRDILMRARAIENQAYCIGINRVGTDGNGWNYTGNSQVVSANGDYIKYYDAQENIVIQTELCLSELNDYRTKFPVGRDW